VKWKGENFDCILLCVDRGSNWVLVRPTLKEGLTGVKAAHFLLGGVWGEVAIYVILRLKRAKIRK